MKTKPYVEDRKAPTSISAYISKVKKAREEGIDLNELLDNALDLAFGKMDKEEIELRKVRKEITSLREKLGPLLSMEQKLEESIENRKTLEVELKLEEDCHSWYLRSLMEEGKVKVITPVIPDQEKTEGFLEYLKNEHGFQYTKKGDVFLFTGQKDDKLQLADFSPHEQ